VTDSTVSPSSSSINLYAQHTYCNKPVGDWISVPSPNFVAMATRVGPEVHWIADFPRQGCRAESVTMGGDVAM